MLITCSTNRECVH